MLTNTEKDVVGFLRATNVCVLLWRLPQLTFPLDEEISKLKVELRAHFEGEASIVAEICSGRAEFEIELASSWQDISSTSKPAYWDERTTELQLSLLSGERYHHKFTFHDRDTFFRETWPIYLRLLRCMIDSVLWVRVYAFQAGTAKQNPINLPELFHRLIYHKVGQIPKSYQIPFDTHGWTMESLGLWRNSVDVRRGLALTNGKSTGLSLALDELRS